MVEKHVGAGSQYLFTPRDMTGAFLDGGKNYRLHLPADVPVKNFWSVVAYDADSRSLLRAVSSSPRSSTYTGPAANADGSIDVFFGPDAPPAKETTKNWIKTTGQGMVRAVPFLWPARTVLRPDVEAGRRRPDVRGTDPANSGMA